MERSLGPNNAKIKVALCCRRCTLQAYMDLTVGKSSC
jgi:hypothetical protein